MINQSSIRILSVDDHPLLREGLAAIINNQPDMQIVAEAARVLKRYSGFVNTGPTSP